MAYKKKRKPIKLVCIMTMLKQLIKLTEDFSITLRMSLSGRGAAPEVTTFKWAKCSLVTSLCDPINSTRKKKKCSS